MSDNLPNGYEWITSGGSQIFDSLHYEGVQVSPSVSVQARARFTDPGLAPTWEWWVLVGDRTEVWGTRESAQDRAFCLAEMKGLIR